MGAGLHLHWKLGWRQKEEAGKGYCLRRPCFPSKISHLFSAYDLISFLWLPFPHEGGPFRRNILPSFYLSFTKAFYFLFRVNRFMLQYLSRSLRGLFTQMVQPVQGASTAETPNAISSQRPISYHSQHALSYTHIWSILIQI